MELTGCGFWLYPLDAAALDPDRHELATRENGNTSFHFVQLIARTTSDSSKGAERLRKMRHRCTKTRPRATTGTGSEKVGGEYPHPTPFRTTTASHLKKLRGTAPEDQSGSPGRSDPA